jgi:antitoxin component YwqK of YwqJK toxin-antitoxin module
MTTPLEDGAYKDGKKNGPWILYYAEGGKRREGAYDLGRKTGEWIEYHKNGQPASINQYREDKPTGQHIAYYGSGGKKQTGQFNEFAGKWSDGKKTGTWAFYDSDGKTVWRYITYKNGSRSQVDEHPLGLRPACTKPIQSPSWERCPKCDADLVEHLE